MPNNLKQGLKKIFYNTHVLVGLHVALLISIAFMLINAGYQTRFYQALVKKTVTPEMNEQEAAIALMNISHTLINQRNEIFGENIKRGLKEKLFNSSQETLTGGGACGNFVHVLGRALETAGYAIRIAQMEVKGIYGGHIVLETLINGQWAVLDPSFNTAYIKENGELASFEEVGSNWEYFKAQTPPEYPDIYNYEGVRYTNWEKVPIVMPIMKRVLAVTFGEESIKFLSLRAYTLRVYRVRALILGIAYIGVLLLTTFAIRDRVLRSKSDKHHREGI